MATKAEVEFWKDMCRKLTGIMDRQDEIYTEVMSRLNARTEELKSLQAIVDGLEWQVEDLQAENDKLRELVRDYYIYEHSSCYSCCFYDECHGVGCESREPFCIAPIRLGERTRDLGVEVDDV